MNIRVDLNTPIRDGMDVKFRSPVDCSQITGLIVCYNGESKEFAFADAHGNNVGDIDHLFAENVVVKVILDVTTGMAFVQNADTNAYLEGRFQELEEKIGKGGGGSVNKYYYTSLSAAVTDLNASTTENAKVTAENAECSLHTDADGNTCLTLLADIALAGTVTISAPVIFVLNGHTVSIPGDYLIDITGNNSIVDGRTVGSQIIKNTSTNTVAYVLRFTGNNCKLFGGFYSITAPADTKLVSCIMSSSDTLTMDGAEVNTKSVSGRKSTYGVVTTKILNLINSTIDCNSANGPSFGVISNSKTETLTIKNCKISASSQSVINGDFIYSVSAYFLSVENSKIYAESDNITNYGIMASTSVTIKDCEVYVDAIHGGAACVYVSEGSTALAENSSFFADGTTGSVSAGNENYAGTQGIINYGTLTVKNCNAYGTHTGFQCSEGSITTIDGGLYEGPGHGGIYIACDNGGKFFAENATFKNVPYRGKHKDTFFYSNGQYMVAAVYVGGGDNIKAYFDSCILDGCGPEAMPDGDSFTGAEPIRFRMSSGERNNSAYMSNCTLMGDGKIRFANATHKLHYGMWNRFLCEPNLESSMIDEGRVIYTGYEQFRTI